MGAGPSTGFVWASTDDPACFTMEDLTGGDDVYGFEELRSSQLPGAPIYPTQEGPSHTPVPPQRPPRHAGPPPRFTYSSGHMPRRGARRTRPRTGE